MNAAEKLAVIAESTKRDAIIADTVTKLIKSFTPFAEAGRRESDPINLNALCCGAEDLFEVSEMLGIMAKVLHEEGFEATLTPEGCFIVSW